MDLDIFRTDAELDTDGAWVDVEFRGQKGKFKIARAGNPKFNRIYTKLKNAKRFSNPGSKEAQEYNEYCLNRALAEAILIDTGDEITNKGEPVKYTPDLGFQLMCDESLSELKNQIVMAAGDFEQYAVIKLESIEGNS